MPDHQKVLSDKLRRRDLMKQWTMATAALGLIAAGAITAPIVRAEPASRTFQFRYRAVVKEIPAGAQKVEVWLPFPSNDAHQTIDQVSIDAPRPITISREHEYGNPTLYVRVDHPAQREIPVEVTFTATRREYLHRTADGRTPRPLPAAERARFLQPDHLVPIDGRIRQLALDVTKGKTTELEKARAIYDYVTRTVKYDKSGTGWGRGDALYVCDARAGNCTDFHSLIIGMARAVGMPAKFAIGFPLPAQRGSGDIPGYHCWAEVYVSDVGWIPLDSSEASKHPEKLDYFFGAHDENRVQLTVGRDITLNPKQAGEPLNYFVYPYVEVDGKPYTAIDKQFAFTDKPASDVLASR
jgi:transglutaminase-like putative cysteine protease